MLTTVLILLVAIIVPVLIIIGMYNKLVALRNAFKNAFAQIDVQLKRRYDLIPNLVETARGYLKHERETLENVIAARNQASSANVKAAGNPGIASSITALAGAESVLGSALGRLFAVVEDYPDLKANTTMNQLMEELTSAESRVSFARQAFNDAVMSYNNACQMFPSSLVASSFGFSPAALLKSTSGVVERTAPKVTF